MTRSQLVENAWSNQSHLLAIKEEKKTPRDTGIMTIMLLAVRVLFFGVWYHSELKLLFLAC